MVIKLLIIDITICLFMKKLQKYLGNYWPISSHFQNIFLDQKKKKTLNLKS